MRLLTKESGDSAEFGLGPRAIGFGRQPPATASHEAERKEKQSHQRPLKPLQTQGAGQDSRKQNRPGLRLRAPTSPRRASRGQRHRPISLCRARRLSATPHPGSPAARGRAGGRCGRDAGWPQKGGPRLEGGVSLHTSPCQPHEGRWQGSPPRPVCCHQAERGGVRLLSCTP